MNVYPVIITLFSGVLFFAAPQSNSFHHSSQNQTPQSLMTRVRRFVGTQPRSVSVGGTRSNENKSVCLLYPGPIKKSNDISEVIVVDSRPTLFLGSQLNEIEISSDDDVLWSQMASSKQPIEGQILWPISPIKAEQKLQLGLRPRGVSGGDWARMTLIGASKSKMNDYQKVLKTTSGSISKRLKAIDSAIKSNEDSKALALLWAEIPSSDKAIKKLRKGAIANCPN
tara:strand:+ start:419 stop:1096 length:678 start_codon:yes stop_codon:yes gene_type:complete